MSEGNMDWWPPCMPLIGDGTRRMTLQSAKPPARHNCLLLKGEIMPRSFWALTAAGQSNRGWGTDQEVSGTCQVCGSGFSGKSGYRNKKEVRCSRLCLERKIKVSEDSLAWRIRKLVQVVRSQKALAIEVSGHLSEVIQLGSWRHEIASPTQIW